MFTKLIANSVLTVRLNQVGPDAFRRANIGPDAFRRANIGPQAFQAAKVRVQTKIEGIRGAIIVSIGAKLISIIF